MPPRVEDQPTPQEYTRKAALFEKLVNTGKELQKARRALGLNWIEAGSGAFDGIGETRVHARQSGLIIVGLASVAEDLHIEPSGTATRLGEFHRVGMAKVSAEYVFDEAMFVPRQS